MDKSRLETFVKDRIAPQVDAYTWYRYSLIAPFLPKGPLRSLNVGSGGGIETLRLLERGHHVVTVEIDEETSARTHERAVRAGHGERHESVTGHFLKVDVPGGPYDLVLMCEVLEHIIDDRGVLQKLASLTKPGARLVMSTPTSSYGMLPTDQLSVTEDGGHVRPGYDGPELDRMLSEAGFVTIRRVMNGGLFAQWQHRVERRVARHVGLAAARGFGLACRPFVPVIDAVAYQPMDQITIATRAS